MNLELEFERLAFRRTEAQNSAQSVVEGTLALPAGAPEIGHPLKLEASPDLSGVEVKEGKVIFEGTLNLQLLYARFEERPASYGGAGEEGEAFDGYDRPDEPQAAGEVLEKAAWRRETPFAFVLDLPGAAEGDAVETAVEVEECSFDLRPDRMTLDVDAVLSFSARKVREEEVRVATAARSSGVEAETRPVRVRNLLGRASTAVEAEGELSFAGFAAPQTLLRVEAEPEVTEAFVDAGEVRVRGHVHCAAFYVGAGGTGPQFVRWPRGLSYEAVVPVPGARRGASADVNVTAALPEARVVPAGDARELSVRVPLALRVVVHDTREVPVVTALTSDRAEIAVRTERVVLVEAVGEGGATERTETRLELPGGLPGIGRVLWGEAKASVDDVHVLGDKVAVEFHVDVEMAYLGRAQEEEVVRVARWPKAVEMDIEIPLEGAEPGLERRAWVEVESIDFDVVGRDCVDARVVVTARAAVSREVEVDAVVEAVFVPPEEESPPTYTFVVTGPGDTVWKLAARYRTKPEVIAQANEWLTEAEGELPAGRKVCVPRRVNPEPAA